MCTLATTDRPLRSAATPNGSPTVESVVEAVRALWTAAEGANEEARAKLKQDITQTVDRLKHRVESRLGKPVASAASELLLFDASVQQPVDVEIAIPSSPPRFAEPVLRVYAKDFADHALQHLPQAAKYNSIENFRNYLADKLRFNSEATRRRSANYIVSRFFPGEVYNEDLPQFAAATRGTPALGEALFYLTCRTERIVSLVAEEIVFPSIAQGGVGRTRLREYVQSKFPQSKSVEDIGQAIVRSYQFYGIGSPNRTRLNVSLREGSLVSFAYVMHLEFPEPGMYAFEKMFEGPMHKWLLWDRQWMVHQLYKLREAGLLAKVSEIDRMRQFTTKYTLAEALQHIVALAKESPE
jgi:DNA repair protein RadC